MSDNSSPSNTIHNRIPLNLFLCCNFQELFKLHKISRKWTNFFSSCLYSHLTKSIGFQSTVSSYMLKKGCYFLQVQFLTESTTSSQNLYCDKITRAQKPSAFRSCSLLNCTQCVIFTMAFSLYPK